MNGFEILPSTESVLPSDLDCLQNRLQETLGGRVRDFQIHHHDDGIVLRGFTRTYYLKQLVQHAVMSETNSPIIANEIEVV